MYSKIIRVKMIKDRLSIREKYPCCRFSTLKVPTYKKKTDPVDLYKMLKIVGRGDIICVSKRRYLVYLLVYL